MLQILILDSSISSIRGGFISPRLVAELLDIEGASIPAIPDQTEYVRDRYGIQGKYLALTSDESGGMYLYDKGDSVVYDIDILVLNDFIKRKVPARWATFNDFLTWYFESSV
ncbi:hypothetical protein CFB46_06065 [Burkholderia sp. HI2761]|nr:hypothetical protein CFB46_06065 [Burkholderia sp. HI2761]